MLNQLQKYFTAEELMTAEFGLEREALRVNEAGNLSLVEHPKGFGNKIDNPYITTDFSESQIEMITPVFNDSKACHDFLSALYDIVAVEIGDELLWPQSMPCKIEQEDNIPIAIYGDDEKGEESYRYRQQLIKKYGGKKQLICGIHYNFSFTDPFLKKLHKLLDEKEDYEKFRERTYLKISRNYLRYRWLLIYLLGATANLHESYEKECVKKLNKVGDESYNSETASSIRNGKCGYKNKKELYLNYTSVDDYIKSIEDYIEEGVIVAAREVYSPIRLKSKDKNAVLESLKSQGINYLEIRILDINPFEKSGVSLEDLHFIHLFILYALIKEEDQFENWQIEAYKNERQVAGFGQKEDLKIKRLGQDTLMRDWGIELIQEMLAMNTQLGLGKQDILLKMQERLRNTDQTYARRIGKVVKQEGYLKGHLEIARQYKKEAYGNRFKLSGYEDMELSTQILMKEAIKSGIKVEIIDRKEQFIRLKKKETIQYIKQATKTSADNYVAVLLMENKVVTKRVLQENAIVVPQGIEIDQTTSVESYINEWQGQPVVVKPKSTNFGLGISIFPKGADKDDLETAVQIALRHDKDVLLERFIEGEEYRFLVIQDKVEGILRRIPANVMGDGVHMISELVKEKNKDLLRGCGYKTPLEKIVLDEQSALYLKQQGLTFNAVPAAGERVYLRENSNISTGGDSIDYTDEIVDYYKRIAIKSAQAVGAKICGVDMLIKNIKQEGGEYGVIEMNFNPAIHIHCFPYKGIERNIATSILKLLEF